MRKEKLYLLLFLICLAGYIWLFYEMMILPSDSSWVGVCLFKSVTHIPCPSCGTTRAILALLHGDFMQSLFINPLGIVSAGIMVVIPVWIVFDVTTGKDSLHAFYKRTEVFLKKPGVAVPLVVLILINWVWNILKDI